MNTEKYFLNAKTIQVAQNSGLYTPGQIGWMQSTQNSGNIEDVYKHRGIETTLKNTIGFNSPSYSQNCQKIHEFDNQPSKVPFKK